MYKYSLLTAYLCLKLINYSHAQDKKCMCEEVEGFRYDTDSFTNLRDKPNGKIIQKLIPDEDEIEPILMVCKAENQWFYVETSNGTWGWIHYKKIAASLRNYDGNPVTLYKEPNRAKGIQSIVKESEPLVQIINCSGRWAYVYVPKTKQEGWVEGYLLCPNSVTTCP